MDAAPEYQSVLDYTWFPNDSRNSGNISYENADYWPEYDDTYFHSVVGFMLISLLIIICIWGVVGNGIVIWLLAFRVQRNSFMTYILNLAIADFGALLSGVVFVDPFYILSYFAYKTEVVSFLPLLTYSASQYLLTTISIDRCVAIFFPLWHRCHRPPRLPIIVCALMWLLSFLLTTLTITLLLFHRRVNIQYHYQFIVNAVLCLPLVTISTLALFIKVCLQQRQRRRGKLLTILLLTLAFYLLFAFPFNAISILMNYGRLDEHVLNVGILLACLNSSVNPVIYFLVGRQRKTRRRQSLKMILQRVFKEEEGCPEGSPAETQL